MKTLTFLKPAFVLIAVFLSPFVSALLLIPVQAQNGPTAQEDLQTQQDPKLKPNPLEALRNFEPAEDEEYRLGMRDAPTFRPSL